MIRSSPPQLTTLSVLVAAYIGATLLETFTLLLYSGHIQGQRLAEYYGWASLACLAVVLASPALGWQGLRHCRRGLGLASFGFALAHTWQSYAHVFDSRWELVTFLPTGEQIAFWLGVVGLVLMLPLVATSTDGWLRRLGKNWRHLHRLVYLVALVALGHALWLGAAGWGFKAMLLCITAAIVWLRRSPRSQLAKEPLDA